MTGMKTKTNAVCSVMGYKRSLFNGG